MAVHLDGGIQHPQNNLQVGGAVGANSADAPAALANARQGNHSVGRVLAAVFSLGISEGVLAIIKAVQTSRAPAPQVTQTALRPQAPPAADVMNRKLASTLKSNGKLPDTMKVAIEEGLESLRSDFGDAVPSNGKAPTKLKYALAEAIRNDPEEVTPERLCAMVKDLGKPVMASASLEKQSQAMILDIGYPSNHKVTIGHIDRGPFAAMQGEIASCQNSTEVGAVLTRYETPLREHLTSRLEIETCQRDTIDNAYQRLADASGISKDTLTSFVALEKLEKSMSLFTSNETSSEKPLHGKALQEHFAAFANPIVESKIETLASIEGLEISSSTKDTWKNSVLCCPPLSDPNFLPKLDRAASNISVDSLINAFKDPDLSDEDTLLVFQSVALKFHEALKSSFGEQGFAELFAEPYIIENTDSLGMMAILDKHPDLVEVLRAAPERFGRVASLAIEAVLAAKSTETKEDTNINTLVKYAELVFPPTAQQANNQLAKGIADEKLLPLVHIDALRAAIAEMRADFGEDSFTAGVNLQAMQGSSSGKAIVDKLTEQLKKSNDDVTVEKMKDMCKTAIRDPEFTTRASCGIISEMAQAVGMRVDDDDVKNIFSRLLEHYPTLEENLAAAPSRLAMQNLLQEALEPMVF